MLTRLSENLMWKDASQDMVDQIIETNLSILFQLDFAGKTVERVIMAQIHNMAFYPNVEADIHRDELVLLNKNLRIVVIAQCLAPIASQIGANDYPRPSNASHTKGLQHDVLHSLIIIQELQGEAPWPSAQADIEILNAYKSPRDKLQVTDKHEMLDFILALMTTKLCVDQIFKSIFRSNQQN